MDEMNRKIEKKKCDQRTKLTNHSLKRVKNGMMKKKMKRLRRGKNWEQIFERAEKAIF